MTSTLPTLAPELIDIIATNLEHTDLFALRIVCKSLSLKTLHKFARECFHTLQTDLSYKSFQYLKEISEHEGLRHHIQRLCIEEDENGIFRDDSTWVRNPSGYDQLRRILLNLVNCRSFHIRGKGQLESSYEVNDPTPSDAVAIILRVIVETALPVKTFEVDFRTCDIFAVDATKLSFHQYREPMFLAGWAHLQTLFLDYAILSDTVPWAAGLVRSGKSLQKLCVVSKCDEHSMLFISLLSSANTLPRLRSLRLGVIAVPEKLLTIASATVSISFLHGRSDF